MLSLTLAALAAALLLAALVGTGPGEGTAQAAPCGPPSFALAGGQVRISGTTCSGYSEDFTVICSGGSVAVEYAVDGVLLAPTAVSAYPCGTPISLKVEGYEGGDVINLSKVTRANGFTGLTQPTQLIGGIGNDAMIGSELPDAADGGSGNDLILIRGGGADTGDCGSGFDSAQGDQPGVDSFSACEILDLLPATAPPAAPAAVIPAKKNCKKIKNRAKRRKCRRKNR